MDRENNKLDYTIQSPEQRLKKVNQIIQNTPAERLTPKYLESMADYLVFAITKEEKKKKLINTENRMITINKRETSFQGLAAKFQNGEDGIYNIIANDKNIIFTPKISITAEDLQQIPQLRELREQIQRIEKVMESATGKRKRMLKKQLIQMRQDQYVIKNAYKRNIYCLNGIRSFNSLSFNNIITITDQGQIQDNSLISFFNPKHLSALLCNYSKLKEDCYGKFYTDGYYLMEDLDTLIQHTLRDRYPLYYSLLIYKIDGKQNIQIQSLLQAEHHIKHSIQYISALWRNKIPKLLADQAEKEYLLWYYQEQEYGKWKKCSRCGQIKLAHNKFFSRNNSSKDGFYSICKECRNKKTKEKSHPKIIKRIPYIKPETEVLNVKEIM